MGDGIQIVGVVVGVGVLHIHPGGFQFHKQQRDAIDKAHNVGTAAVQVAVDLQFLDGEKMVVARVLEVDHGGVFLLCLAAGLLHGDGDAVPDQEILLLVDLQQGGGGQAVFHEPLGLVHLSGGDPGVQAQQGLPEIAGQQDLLVALAAKGAGFAQLLGVVGIDDLPAQLVPEQVAGAALNQDVFGVVVAHGVTSFPFVV